MDEHKIPIEELYERLGTDPNSVSMCYLHFTFFGWQLSVRKKRKLVHVMKTCDCQEILFSANIQVWKNYQIWIHVESHKIRNCGVKLF